METLTKTKWSIDSMHSEINFKVKHLVISTVTGSFTKYEGSLESDGENFDGAKASINIDAASVTTRVADRDAHLRSADFFNAEQYPHLKFEGVLKKQAQNSYTLTGPLTIKDVTKTITLDVDFGGTMVDGYGQKKAGFELRGKINRKEFGLTWSMVTEAGGVVVGDEIKLDMHIQLTLQK